MEYYNGEHYQGRDIRQFETEEKKDQLIFEEMKYIRDIVLNKDYSSLYDHIESTNIYLATHESVEERWEDIRRSRA